MLSGTGRSCFVERLRGPVFCQPICDALGDITVIDLAVVYPVATDQAASRSRPWRLAKIRPPSAASHDA
jgi:hypothetical protein